VGIKVGPQGCKPPQRHSRDGEYDPVKRLDNELDYQQELADRRYTRGL
jgi:hypothetical protein